MKKTEQAYGLKCKWFDKTFPTVDLLIEYIITSGMDPNYEITRNGKPTGEKAISLIQF